MCYGVCYGCVVVMGCTRYGGFLVAIEAREGCFDAKKCLTGSNVLTILFCMVNGSIAICQVLDYIC